MYISEMELVAPVVATVPSELKSALTARKKWLLVWGEPILFVSNFHIQIVGASADEVLELVFTDRMQQGHSEGMMERNKIVCHLQMRGDQNFRSS